MLYNTLLAHGVCALGALVFLVFSQDRLLELPYCLIDLPACPNDRESHNKTVNAPACHALCHL